MHIYADSGCFSFHLSPTINRNTNSTREIDSLGENIYVMKSEIIFCLLRHRQHGIYYIADSRQYLRQA